MGPVPAGSAGSSDHRPGRRGRRGAAFCPECGETLEAGAAFCYACGAEVGEGGDRDDRTTEGPAGGASGTATAETDEGPAATPDGHGAVQVGEDEPRRWGVVGGYVLGAVGLLIPFVGVVGIALAWLAQRAGNPKARRALVVAAVLTVTGVALNVTLIGYCLTDPAADPGLCGPILEGLP